mmetsp:Transcript_40846/g.118025  ORF Transcript_40846/g.118025 Transcript_40846/m.118025 type:complete len:213 (+) Transcript_40846:1079-1717(+)
MRKVVNTGAELHGKGLDVAVLDRVQQCAQDGIKQPKKLHPHTWPRFVVLECRCLLGACREVDASGLCDVLRFRQTDMVDHTLQHPRRECPTAESKHKDLIAVVVLLRQPLVAIQHVLLCARAKVPALVIGCSGPCNARLVMGELQRRENLLGEPPECCDVAFAELAWDPVASLAQLSPRAVIEHGQLPTLGESCGTWRRLRCTLRCLCGTWR